MKKKTVFTLLICFFLTTFLAANYYKQVSIAHLKIDVFALPYHSSNTSAPHLTKVLEKVQQAEKIPVYLELDPKGNALLVLSPNHTIQSLTVAQCDWDDKQAEPQIKNTTEKLLVQTLTTNEVLVIRCHLPEEEPRQCLSWSNKYGLSCNYFLVDNDKDSTEPIHFTYSFD